MPDSPKGLRELLLNDARELPGLWVPAGLGDAPSGPLTPLGWQLMLNDEALVRRAFSERGASLPRLARRLINVGGYAYQSWLPLARAARSLAPLDAAALALAIAGQARDDARRLLPESARISGLGLGQAALGARRGLDKFERGVARHEQDAAQHYRWLVEMDLGILPDDALGTTLEECCAFQRATRGLQIEVTLELLISYAALTSYTQRRRVIPTETLAIAALVPDPLELPGATPALAFVSLARATSLGRAPSARHEPPAALREFLDGFGERGPNEREPAAPRWREQSERIAKLSEKLDRGALEQFELRMGRAQSERQATLGRALGSVGPLDRALLQALFSRVRRLVLLRSRLNRVRAGTLWMLRTVVLDVDRRLMRLIRSEPNSAFFLAIEELLDGTVRAKPELSALSRERRAAWQLAWASWPPPAVLGRAAQSSALDGTLTGVGVGGDPVTGPAHVASSFERALETPPRAVLVTRSLDAGWAPLLIGVAAVVTDAGGLADEGTLVAAALGVPLVVGTAEATRRIEHGSSVRLDLRAGTVVPV